MPENGLFTFNDLYYVCDIAIKPMFPIYWSYLYHVPGYNDNYRQILTYNKYFVQSNKKNPSSSTEKSMNRINVPK